MFKRIFSLFLGLGLGLFLGAYVVRRIDRAAQAVTPTNIAAGAGRAAGAFVERFRAALAEGRQVAETEEARLRAEHGVPNGRAGVTGA